MSFSLIFPLNNKPIINRPTVAPIPTKNAAKNIPNTKSIRIIVEAQTSNVELNTPVKILAPKNESIEIRFFFIKARIIVKTQKSK